MRTIPGKNEVKGREIVYLESENCDAFRSIFPKITSFGISPLPKSGGAINEEFLIVLPDGVQMFALSYKGDLVGWKRKINECAAVLGLKIGEIVGEFLELQKENIFPLAVCEVKDLLETVSR